MSIEKKAFRRYNEEEPKEIVKSVKFNQEEEAKLNLLMELLQTEQHSSAIKQAIDTTIKVILDQKTITILSHVLNNYRRNKRKGVVTFDDTDYKKYIKSN